MLTAFLASLLRQLALHIPLSSIPLSQTTPTADQHESDPPKTAIQHLVEDAHSRDYDLVCVSLTNSSVFPSLVHKRVAPTRSFRATDPLCFPTHCRNWRERWESLCLRAADAPDDPESRRRTEEDAERWRMGGGFRRSEVTVTRLGQFFLTATRRALQQDCRANDDSLLVALQRRRSTSLDLLRTGSSSTRQTRASGSTLSSFVASLPSTSRSQAPTG